MKSINKAQSCMRDLCEKLSLRYAGSSTIDTVRQAADANGWPMAFLSDGGVETAGSDVIVLRIKGLSVLPLDQFQQAQFAYAPHQLEIAYELDANGKPEPEAKDLLKAMFECTKTGIKIIQEEIADGTAVSEASMNASSPVSELNDLYWPNKGV